MSTVPVAADQILCVRVLSLILPDGTLSMPSHWTIQAYPDLDFTPRLEGLFHDSTTPPVSVLREQIRAYADKFGLHMTEKPHGATGQIAMKASGLWQGVELIVWGPARPEDDAEPSTGSERA